MQNVGSNFRMRNKRKKGSKAAKRSQTGEYFVNLKNATNVSAADSVARGTSIYMRPRAKLGDRREREIEAGASVRLNSLSGKKFQFLGVRLRSVTR